MKNQRPYGCCGVHRARGSNKSVQHFLKKKKDSDRLLIEIYDIKTEADFQEALKDLLGGTIQDMLEVELDRQIEAREKAEPEYTDSRNGYKLKTLRSSMDEMPIRVPQDRNSDFEPQVMPKYKKNISEIKGKIIAMYARGMSVAQVSEQIRNIYGFEVSEGMVTAIANKLLPEIEAWQKRPLSTVYPIGYIDAIVCSIREVIAAAYPLAECQRCIVHLVRNALKYVADKNKKSSPAT